MSEVVIIIPGRPSTGSTQFTKAGFAYTPKNVAEWKAYVKLMVQEVVAEMIPKYHPVEVTIILRRPRPDYPKKPTAKKPCPWAWVTKPDVDNVNKPLFDCLKTLAFHDDAQVTDLHIKKRWGDREEVEIRFHELSEDEL